MTTYDHGFVTELQEKELKARKIQLDHPANKLGIKRDNMKGDKLTSEVIVAYSLF